MRIVLFFIFISISACFAQDRVNKKLPEISKNPIGIIKQAKGWFYDNFNNQGQWYSSNNRIPYSEKDIEYFSIGQDNFEFYEFREIYLDSVKLVLFIKKWKDGDYKYPAIEKGWYTYPIVYYYLISVEDYESLKQIKIDGINSIKIKILDRGETTSKNYLDDIRKNISYRPNNKFNFNYSSKLSFNIYPISKDKLVRFFIFVIDYNLNKKGIMEDIKRADNFNVHHSMEMKYIKKDEDLFNTVYYETDFKTFEKFITK